MMSSSEWTTSPRRRAYQLAKGLALDIPVWLACSGERAETNEGIPPATSSHIKAHDARIAVTTNLKSLLQKNPQQDLCLLAQPRRVE